MNSGGELPSKVIPEVKRLYLDSPIAAEGLPKAVIVVPDNEEYEDEVVQLLSELQSKYGVSLPIKRVSWDDIEQNLGEENRTVILVGNVLDNPGMQELYAFSYTSVDHLFPGENGYELRTVHDPWGRGTNAIIIGGSSKCGIQKASDAFLESLVIEDDVLVMKKTIKVEIDEELRGIFPNFFVTPDEAVMNKWRKETQVRAQSGAQGVATPLLGDLGQLYNMTGHDQWAQLYKELLLEYYYSYVLGPNSLPGKEFGSWGFDADFFSREVILGWDMVEESSVFSDEDRLEITHILLEYLRHCVPHLELNSTSVTRTNHQTFAALGLFFGGSYFSKYYGIEDARQWLDLAEQVFLPQMNYAKAGEDSNGYQWLVPYHTLTYSLGSSDYRMMENGALRRMLDIVLLSMDNLGYQSPYGDVGSILGWYRDLPLLSIGSWWYRSPEYQWAYVRRREQSPVKDAYLLNTYISKSDVAQPERLLGVSVAEVDRGFLDEFREQSKRAVSPFDKISFRWSFSPDEEYLLLDGISGGSHGHYDANSVVRYTDKGRILLDDGDYIKKMPKYHNTVQVMKDGELAFPPGFAELEYVGDLPDVGYSRTSLSPYSGAYWARNILWVKDKFFMVIDDLTALEAGDYHFRFIWRSIGAANLNERTFTARQKDVRLQITNLDDASLAFVEDMAAAKNWARYGYARGSVKVLVGTKKQVMNKDETYRFVNVLQAVDTDCTAIDVRCLGEKTFAVYGTEPGVLGFDSTDEDESTIHGLSTLARMYYITQDSFSVIDGDRLWLNGHGFASTFRININLDFESGLGVIEAMRSTEVQISGRAEEILINGDSVAFMEHHGKVIFNAEKGTNSIQLVGFDPGDTLLFGESISEALATCEDFDSSVEGESIESTPFLRQMWQTDIVGSLDENEKAYISTLETNEERGVVCGTSIGRVYRLDDSGEELWHFDADSQIRSTWFGDMDGESRTLLGTMDGLAYALDSRGEMSWSFKPDFYMETSTVETIFPSDVNSDGRSEVIIGARNWHFYALDGLGKMIWKYPVVRGSTIGCAADIDGDGRQEIVAGTEYYIWHVINNNGTGRWSYRSGPGVSAVEVAQFDTGNTKAVIFGSLDSNVYAFTHRGTLIWKSNVGDEPTHIIARDVDGDGLDELLVSSMSHFLFCLNEKGDKQWRLELDSTPLISEVVSIPDSDEPYIVTITEDGSVYLISTSGNIISTYDMGENVKLAQIQKRWDFEKWCIVVATSSGEVAAFQPALNESSK